jgi:hypothetical protein|tara:strand:+ start:3914 stop:4159 length:246 start_codon:yes stop_codon:yes gene_type:complete
VSSIQSFNPLVQSFDLLSDREVEDKILALNKRYWQTQNPQVREQITAILDMFKVEIEGRRAKPKNNSQDGDNSLDNLINIS